MGGLFFGIQLSRCQQDMRVCRRSLTQLRQQLI
jgi:hypothetical protein